MTTIVHCCTCGTDIHMQSAQEKALRKNHKSFFCPMGHDNYFPGKTEEEKKIERLEKELAQAKREAKQHWMTAEHWMGEADYHTCVFSRCMFRSKTKKKVREHMATCAKGVLLLPATAGPDAHGTKITQH